MKKKINMRSDNDQYMDVAFPSGARINHIEVLAEQLEMQPELVNRKDMEYGLTALHYAAGFGNLDAIELLLNQPDIDVGIKDAFGRDALDLAISAGQSEVVDRLFQHRADRNKRNLIHLRAGSSKPREPS